MNKKLKYLFKLIFFLGLILGADKSFALTISPPVKDLTGDPGETVQGIIKIYNETNAEVTVYSSLAGFQARDGGMGEPEIIPLEENTLEGLASWIKLPEGPFTIKPLDWQNIVFNVSIPADAEPGGHYAAVFFSPNKNETIKSGAVSVDYRTGSLILLNVSGETLMDGEVKYFKSKKNFYEYVPVSLELLIENNGNVHFKPNGGVKIENMLGNPVIEIAIIKSITGGNVLPGSVRKYEVVWEEKSNDDLPKSFWDKVKYERKNFHLGKYSALATIGLPDGSSENRVVSFWIIPWQLLLVAILFLAVIIQLFRWYNRWIIRKAREGR